MQEHIPPQFSSEATRLNSGDELDFQSAQDVDSYKVGHERAQAAAAAQAMRGMERAPLASHQIIGKVSSHLADFRLWEAEMQEPARRHSDHSEDFDLWEAEMRQFEPQSNVDHAR